MGKYTHLSKYLSLIRRHKPELIGIKLDKTGNKQRYVFNENKTLTRATEGHFIPVDMGLEETKPSEYLWNGTGVKYVKDIDKYGLVRREEMN